MPKNINNKIRAEIIWAATRQGALQRARIYKEKNVTKEQKSDFRDSVQEYLFEKVFKQFKNTQITEVQLYKLIVGLQASIGTEFLSILKGGTLKFGHAQKFVNLYIKSMWIAGWIKTPPHFPVDRRIQEALSLKVINWTNMDVTQYKSIIREAKKFIDERGYPNLALLEAYEYLTKMGRD